MFYCFFVCVERNLKIKMLVRLKIDIQYCKLICQNTRLSLHISQIIIAFKIALVYILLFFRWQDISEYGKRNYMCTYNNVVLVKITNIDKAGMMIVCAQLIFVGTISIKATLPHLATVIMFAVFQ